MQVELPLITKAGKQLQGKILAAPCSSHPWSDPLIRYRNVEIRFLVLQRNHFPRVDGASCIDERTWLVEWVRSIRTFLR